MIELGCRACGRPGLAPILSLGHLPLANALLAADELDRPEETFPLELGLCTACTLVQLTHTVPPEKLFSNYLYLSSFSDTFLTHAQTLAERMTENKGLTSRSLVVEIGSNDGYLLQFYRRRGVPVLGIEPAANVAEIARSRGIETACAFFGEALGLELRGQGRVADIVHAHNVLAHVPDLPGFLAGVSALLKDDGVAVIEVPHVVEMIDRNEFDTIYHEHLCYFSLTALVSLFERCGLELLEAQSLPVHGGSLRVMARRRQGPAPMRAAAVDEWLVREEAWGVRQLARYSAFEQSVRELIGSLRSFLLARRTEGRRIAAYGASAKGTTLLNCLGLTRDAIGFVVDRNPLKQGRYTPGLRLPIYPPERLLEAMPDFVLLLTWNFAEEIMAQQSEYRRRGGRFVIPVPQLMVA